MHVSQEVRSVLSLLLSRHLQITCFPYQLASILTGGPFDEPNMPEILEACDWLCETLENLEPSQVGEENFSDMRAVSWIKLVINDERKNWFYRGNFIFVLFWIRSHVAKENRIDFNPFKFSTSFSKVREKRAELERLKQTFCRRASDFLRHYLSTQAENLIGDRVRNTPLSSLFPSICFNF